MRRDEDYSRSLLQELEADHDWIVMSGIHLNSSDEDRTRYYHLRLLADAGFLEESGKHGGVFRITNAGHDFLEITRTPERWSAIKVAAKSVGMTTLRSMAAIGEKMGIDALKAAGLWPD